MKYVGLDISQRWIFVCILNAQGKVVKEFKVANDGSQLLERLDGMKGPLSICYEASCGYGHLHDQLKRLARRILVAHPGRLRLIFQSRQKNDRVDARKLATLLFLDQVPTVHVPSLDIRAWRSLIEFRNRLVAKRTRAKNGLRAICRTHGVRVAGGKRLWSKKARPQLAALELPHESAALERDLLVDELNGLDERIKRVERELNARGEKHPGIMLLRSIPGVGPRTAEAFVAYVDRPERFNRSKKFGAYFGVVPCQDQSGNFNRLGHITREGPSCVRRLITEAAWQGVQRSPRIRAYFDRILRKDPQRRKIALVATAHYLLRVMHAMLRRGECWNEAGGPHDQQAA